MKRIVVYTVLFALAFAYYFASTEKLEEIDTRLLKTVRMENGLAYDSRDEKILSGILVERDGDGAVLARVSYVSGLLHGTSEYFYRNARLKARVHYEKGLPEGLWEYFKEDGTLDRTETYKNHVLIE